MKVAVLQSNYIPWKGYFDLAHDVDLFVFHDDLQYTKGDWRNRNQIKTPAGLRWLSIPVGTREDRRICDVELPATDWARRHWQALEQHYRKAPHFDRYRDRVHEFYSSGRWTHLAEFCRAFTEWIAHDVLGIDVRFVDSRAYDPQGKKQDRLLDLLRKVRADVYVSGPAAKAYIEPGRFAEEGIELRWKDYSGYPEYPQFYPPFEHAVTILDLLFQTGPDAPHYIWGWRRR